jgi:hypothetical protein
MGILDDAIREHLDLKRSRGADPSEVTRQEKEALGPVRREAATATEDAPADAAPPAEAAPAEEPAPVVPSESSPEPAPEEPAAEEPPAEEPAAAEPPPAEPPASPESVAPPAQETEEWGFEDAKPPAPAPADEDVLEETPEFLQETPEHDRLWFEQKPPRDFDFDG